MDTTDLTSDQKLDYLIKEMSELKRNLDAKFERLQDGVELAKSMATLSMNVARHGTSSGFSSTPGHEYAYGTEGRAFHEPFSSYRPERPFRR